MAGVSLEQIPVPGRCTPTAEMPTDVCWCSSSGGECALLMLVLVWLLAETVQRHTGAKVRLTDVPAGTLSGLLTSSSLYSCAQ